MTISLEEVTLGRTEKSGTVEATLKISSGATWGRRAEWCRNQRGDSWWGGDILISSHCCCDIFGRCVSSSAIFINWFFPLPKKAIPDHLWHTHTHTHTQVLASNGRGGGMYVNPLERVSSLHNSQPSTINNQPSTINNQQSTIHNQQSTINNQHKHLSFIFFSAGRPLCLFLHLLLSSQNPHRRQAQEVAGRSLLIKCVVTKRARRDSWWESWHAWELEGRGRWGKATTMTGGDSFKSGRNKFPSSSIFYKQNETLCFFAKLSFIQRDPEHQQLHKAGCEEILLLRFPETFSTRHQQMKKFSWESWFRVCIRNVDLQIVRKG